MMQADVPQYSTTSVNCHGKYLTFQLAREEFGIESGHVREIMGVPDITAVPQTTPLLRGVMNLRGQTIPVVDLRLKFGFEPSLCCGTACIVVVQVRRLDRTIEVGLIVDKVHEVLGLSASEIDGTPDFGGDQKSAILGLANVKGSLKILLNIDEVLTQQELRRIEQLSAVVN